MQNRACEYTKSFQTAFLVKGPDLCTLDTKVMNCPDMVVVCGYGGTAFSANSPRTLSTCQDGCLVCFTDIRRGAEVVAENC